MEIQITSPSGVTLLTEKRYCPENISVIPLLQEKSVTPGNSQTIAPDTGYAGLSEVAVEAVPTESGSATPSTAAQTVTPSDGKFFNEFTVNATPTEQKIITANGTFTPSAGKFFDSVTVNVNTAKPEQEKSVDITSMNPVEVTPDEGYTLSKVTATPKAPLANTADATAAAGDILSGKTAYVNGAKITGVLGTQTKTATPSDVEQTITPDSGKLLSSVVVAAAPLDSAQTVTAGTAAKTASPSTGNIGIKSVTVNPTPSSAKTVTPTKATQTVSPNSGELLSGVTVNPIPDQYIIPSGTKDITTNGTTDVTSFASVNVNVPAIVDVATAAEMNAKLVAANVGKVYRFTGTTDNTYTNGDLYEVVSE